MDRDDLVEALTAHVGQPGFGQVVLDPEQNEVVLYWKGTPPGDVARLIGEATDATRVRLVHAPFSSIEIRDASMRVFEAARAEYGPGVVGAISGTRDMTGLIINTTEPLDLELLAAEAQMPVRQELGEPVVLLDDLPG